MRRLLIGTLLLIVIGLFGVVLTNNIYAQHSSESEERITLSPAVSKPKLEAGGSAEGKLSLINDGKTPYTLYLYARPFSVSTENYNPDYTTINNRTEAYQWVQFEKTELKLDAGERAVIGYTLNVPKNAAPGGHYAVLFAETQPKSQDGTSIARKKRVGSLLYITVDGNLIEKGSLVDWQAPFFQIDKPVISNARIKNDGNVHFQAKLTARYINIFGRKQFELNQELLIMPGTTRRVDVKWENPPLFGIYKANGNLEYLGKNDVLPARWVIYLPMPIIFGASILVVILISYGIIKRRNHKNKNVNSNKKAKK